MWVDLFVGGIYLTILAVRSQLDRRRGRDRRSLRRRRRHRQQLDN